MAALHSALQILGPTPFSSVPTEEAQASEYLLDVFAKAQLIIDSIPLPQIEELAVGARARSNTTTSAASDVSEISASSARSEPIDPSNISLQKEWGKPIKIAPKDNPLGIAVYKLSGKDGKGAWFARRSVHEGLGFRKWKLGFEREFPESLAVQGGPGEGNVRGIGGERSIEQKEIGGVGKVEVYHLSAQFPGPTTPRDFVTLLITSDSALSYSEKQKLSVSPDHPRHFMVVSRPCIHPECPPRDGFIRGQYESVEFVREIHREPNRSASNLDLKRAESEGLNGGTRLVDGRLSPNSPVQPTAARRRGKTVSFVDSRGAQASEIFTDSTSGDLDDGAEGNPVEWIMVTRSDPGGSVPRFLVERGTPGSIVADASKFLDWACKKEHDALPMETEGAASSNANESTAKDLEAYQTNDHLAGLDGNSSSMKPLQEVSSEPQGVFASISTMAKTGFESYAPQVIVDQLRTDPSSESVEQRATMTIEVTQNDTQNDDASTISSATFASAEEGDEDDSSIKSASSRSTKNPESTDRLAHTKELTKLHDQKKALDEKFAKSREKELRDKEELTSKDQERLRKAEEKHNRQIEKQEEKYKKEVAKLEAKRAKETAKEEERRKRELDKDEKARLMREKDELRQELDVVKKERDIFRDQVGALQRENTSLVSRIGKISEGRSVLKEVQAEVASGSRSRSSSIRRSKETISGAEATVLAGVTKESPSK